MKNALFLKNMYLDSSIKNVKEKNDITPYREYLKYLKILLVLDKNR